MNTWLSIPSAILAASVGMALPHGLLALPAVIQTKGPVIHLTDNLD